MAAMTHLSVAAALTRLSAVLVMTSLLVVAEPTSLMVVTVSIQTLLQVSELVSQQHLMLMVRVQLITVRSMRLL